MNLLMIETGAMLVDLLIHYQQNLILIFTEKWSDTGGSFFQYWQGQ